VFPRLRSGARRRQGLQTISTANALREPAASGGRGVVSFGRRCRGEGRGSRDHRKDRQLPVDLGTLDVGGPLASLPFGSLRPSILSGFDPAIHGWRSLTARSAQRRPPTRGASAGVLPSGGYDKGRDRGSRRCNNHERRQRPKGGFVGMQSLERQTTWRVRLRSRRRRRRTDIRITARSVFIPK